MMANNGGISARSVHSLSGCYLLIVVGEPSNIDHRDVMLQKISKGFLSWDLEGTGCCISAELQYLVDQDPQPEEAKNGEKLIQFVSENLVTEVLINPQLNTLQQCMKNLMNSYTKHKHIIHAGYSFTGSGSWILQDSTYSFSDFLDVFNDAEVHRLFKTYENSISIHLHCASEGDWTTTRLNQESTAKLVKAAVNPMDKCSNLNGIANFVNFLGRYVVTQPLEKILEPSDVVGNIRFSRPTLYIFPGGQGDSALFGVNGFNMLIDGGFNRKACFWDFARHLDRVDAVLVTRINNSNVNGVSSFFKRKAMGQVYPKIGHVFCNIIDRKHSPDGDKDTDSLLVSLAEEGHQMMNNLRQLGLKPQNCFREPVVDAINLYHKVGHGNLDMYVLNPAKDSREVKEFLQQWHSQSSALGSSRMGVKVGNKELLFPLPNLMSICAILVWQPADNTDSITRILFPGSSPQSKIFEGLEKLRHLSVLRAPVCSEKSLKVVTTKHKPKAPFGEIKPTRLSSKSEKIQHDDEFSSPISKFQSPISIIQKSEKEAKIAKQEAKSLSKIQEEKKPEITKTLKSEEKKVDIKNLQSSPTPPPGKAEPKKMEVKKVPTADKKSEKKKTQAITGKFDVSPPTKQSTGISKSVGKPVSTLTETPVAKNVPKAKGQKEATNKKAAEEKNKFTAKKTPPSKKASTSESTPKPIKKIRQPQSQRPPLPTTGDKIKDNITVSSTEESLELDSQQILQDSVEEEKVSVDEKQSLDEEVQGEKDTLKRAEETKEMIESSYTATTDEEDTMISSVIGNKLFDSIEQVESEVASIEPLQTELTTVVTEHTKIANEPTHFEDYEDHYDDRLQKLETILKQYKDISSSISRLPDFNKTDESSKPKDEITHEPEIVYEGQRRNSQEIQKMVEEKLNLVYDVLKKSTSSDFKTSPKSDDSERIIETTVMEEHEKLFDINQQNDEIILAHDTADEVEKTLHKADRISKINVAINVESSVDKPSTKTYSDEPFLQSSTAQSFTEIKDTKVEAIRELTSQMEDDVDSLEIILPNTTKTEKLSTQLGILSTSSKVEAIKSTEIEEDSLNLLEELKTQPQLITDTLVYEQVGNICEKSKTTQQVQNIDIKKQSLFEMSDSQMPSNVLQREVSNINILENTKDEKLESSKFTLHSSAPKLSNVQESQSDIPQAKPFDLIGADFRPTSPANILSPIPEDAPKLLKMIGEVPASFHGHAEVSSDYRPPITAEKVIPAPVEFLRTPDEVADLPIHEEVPTEYDGFYHFGHKSFQDVPESLPDPNSTSITKTEHITASSTEIPIQPLQDVAEDEEPIIVSRLNADHAEMVQLSNGTSPSTSPLSPRSPKDKDAKEEHNGFVKAATSTHGLKDVDMTDAEVPKIDFLHSGKDNQLETPLEKIDTKVILEKSDIEHDVNKRHELTENVPPSPTYIKDVAHDYHKMHYDEETIQDKNVAMIAHVDTDKLITTSDDKISRIGFQSDDIEYPIIVNRRADNETEEQISELTIEESSRKKSDNEAVIDTQINDKNAFDTTTHTTNLAEINIKNEETIGTIKDNIEVKDKIKEYEITPEKLSETKMSIEITEGRTPKETAEYKILKEKITESEIVKEEIAEAKILKDKENKNLEEIAESKHSEGITKCKNLEAIAESKYLEAIAESKYLEAIAESKHPEEIPGKKHSKLTKCKHSEEFLESKHSEEFAESKLSDEFSECKHLEEHAKHKHSEEFSENKHSKEFAESKHSEKFVESKHSEEFAESKHSEEFAESKHSEELAESKHSGKFAESKHTEEIAGSQHSEATGKNKHSEEITESKHLEDITESMHSDGLAESEHSDGLAGNKYSEEITESKNLEGFAESKHLERFAESKHLEHIKEIKHSQGFAEHKHSEGFAEHKHPKESTENKILKEFTEEIKIEITDSKNVKDNAESQVEKVTDQIYSDKTKTDHTSESIMHGKTSERSFEDKAQSESLQKQTENTISDIKSRVQETTMGTPGNLSADTTFKIDVQDEIFDTHKVCDFEIEEPNVGEIQTAFEFKKVETSPITKKSHKTETYKEAKETLDSTYTDQFGVPKHDEETSKLEMHEFQHVTAGEIKDSDIDISTSKSKHLTTSAVSSETKERWENDPSLQTSTISKPNENISQSVKCQFDDQIKEEMQCMTVSSDRLKDLTTFTECKPYSHEINLYGESQLKDTNQKFNLPTSEGTFAEVKKENNETEKIRKIEICHIEDEPSIQPELIKHLKIEESSTKVDTTHLTPAQTTTETLELETVDNIPISRTTLDHAEEAKIKDITDNLSTSKESSIKEIVIEKDISHACTSTYKSNEKGSSSIPVISQSSTPIKASSPPRPHYEEPWSSLHSQMMAESEDTSCHQIQKIWAEKSQETDISTTKWSDDDNFYHGHSTSQELCETSSELDKISTNPFDIDPMTQSFYDFTTSTSSSRIVQSNDTETVTDEFVKPFTKPEVIKDNLKQPDVVDSHATHDYTIETKTSAIASTTNVSTTVLPDVFSHQKPAYLEDKEYEGYYEVHPKDDPYGFIPPKPAFTDETPITKHDLDILSHVHEPVPPYQDKEMILSTLSQKEASSYDEKDREDVDSHHYSDESSPYQLDSPLPMYTKTYHAVDNDDHLHIATRRERSETFIGDDSMHPPIPPIRKISAMEQSYHSDYDQQNVFEYEIEQDEHSQPILQPHLSSLEEQLPYIQEQETLVNRTIPDVAHSPMYISADDDTEEEYKAPSYPDAHRSSDIEYESPYHKPIISSAMPQFVKTYPRPDDLTSDDSDVDIGQLGQEISTRGGHHLHRVLPGGRGAQSEKWELYDKEANSLQQLEQVDNESYINKEMYEESEGRDIQGEERYSPICTPEYGGSPSYTRGRSSSSTETDVEEEDDDDEEKDLAGKLSYRHQESSDKDSPELHRKPQPFATKEMHRQGVEGAESPYPTSTGSGAVSLSSPGDDLSSSASIQDDKKIVGSKPVSRNPFEEWGEPMGLPSPTPPPLTTEQPEKATKTKSDAKSANTKKQQPAKKADNGISNDNKDNKEQQQMNGKSTISGDEVKKHPAENEGKSEKPWKKSQVTQSPKRSPMSGTGPKSSPIKTKRPESPLSGMESQRRSTSTTNKPVVAPIYVDLTYIPHHGNPFYADVEFFRTVRARYYVFSGTNPSKEVFNALLEAKQSWEDPDLEVTIIPTYDTDTLGYWFAVNEELLSKNKIDLAPSASRCTINLQDHETSCSAYRLEF